MSISIKGCVKTLAAAAIAALPTITFGSELDALTPPSSPLSLASQPVAQPEQTKAAANEEFTLSPKYLADAAPAAPNIHGFLSVPFKSAYVTPRGLVVENQGIVIQPVGGLVFPIGDLGALKDFTIVTGIWSSFNSNQDDPLVGWLNEIDYFVSGSWKVGDQVSMALTYGAWFFPQSTAVAKPKTEHNLDLKITYNDKWLSDGWSINPYVDLWWAIAGSSTVVLGDTGDTGYVELGITPTKTVNAGDLPLTFTFPTYISVGPEGYWDATGTNGGENLGLFSISANVSFPLKFIPVQYGNWHLDAGITYDYLINNALQTAGEILSGNTSHNVFIGSVGVGVNF